MSYDPRILGARCNDCPLQGFTAVPSEGPEDASIVFVGEAPGKFEVLKQRPFIGPSGIKLDELLWKNGIRRADVKITNALQCRPEVPGLTGKERYDVKKYMAWLRAENVRRKKEKQELLESPFDCCWPRLRREIFTADRHARRRGAPNGVVVMPLGNFALKRLTGAQGILKYRGSVMQPEKTIVADSHLNDYPEPEKNE